MIIDNLTSLPSTITTGDELPVERGTTTYKIDYNALASAILARLGAGSDNIVDVAHGGTDAATAAAARTNLGITPANIGAALVSYNYSGNIDNLFDTGMYYMIGATGTGGIQDDGKLFGMLLVVKNGSSSRAVQLHVGLFTLGVEFRVYIDSWSAWKTLALTT